MSRSPSILRPAMSASGSAATSRVLPSLAGQLQFHRRVWWLLYTFATVFFLTPLLTYAIVKIMDAGESFRIPPSNMHHRNTDGEFYPSAVRWGVLGFVGAYMVYAAVICVAVARRAGFFPFKVRPMFLVYSSTFWSLFLLLWLASRYLSDFASLDGGGDGFLPPCWLSQSAMAMAQVALMLPYGLRAWQLAIIFSQQEDIEAGEVEAEEEGEGAEERRRPAATTVGIGEISMQGEAKIPGMSRTLDDDLSAPHDGEGRPRLSITMAHSGVLLNGASYVPPSPHTLLSRGTDDLHADFDRLSPQHSPPLSSTPAPTLTSSSFLYVSSSPASVRDLHAAEAHAAVARVKSSPGSLVRSLRRRCGRSCVAHMTDRKLSLLYVLAMVPVLLFSILTIVDSDLHFLTDFYCSDKLPASQSARAFWTLVGVGAIFAFLAGLWSTRGVWDGFSIRRELLMALGFETGILGLVVVSMITNQAGRHRAGEAPGAFNEFLSASDELLMWMRSMLLFHVSMAVPLLESYDLNAVPVTKARVRRGSTTLPTPARGASASIGAFGLGGRTGMGLGLARDPSFGFGSSSGATTPLPIGSIRQSRRGSRSALVITPSTSVVTSGGHFRVASSSFTGGVGASSRGPHHHMHGQGGGLHQPLLADVSGEGTTAAADGMSVHAHLLSSSPSGPSSVHLLVGNSHVSLPLPLSSVIAHPDYFDYFASFVSEDPHMELLWTFYVELSLFQSNVDAAQQAMEAGQPPPEDVPTPRDAALSIFEGWFDAETLRGGTPFSQWLLVMANVLQQEQVPAHGAAAIAAASAPRAAGFRGRALGDREAAEAMARVDTLLQQIAVALYGPEAQGGEYSIGAATGAANGVRRGSTAPLPASLRMSLPPLPRSLFDPFHRAALAIMEGFFYPSFLASDAYRRLLKELRRSSDIQARIDRAHGLI